MKTVLVMLEYVELLTEKNSDVHKQLVNARKVLVDNNIAIEKPVKVDPEMATKTRSVSLVSSAPSVAKRVFYHQEERRCRAKLVTAVACAQVSCKICFFLVFVHLN